MIAIPTNNQRYKNHHRSSNTPQTNHNNSHFNSNSPHQIMPHTDTAVVSYHTHSSPQYNKDDNTSSTIHTHDNLHRSQYHQSPHHTHQQHGHLSAIKTNTRHQNHHYMHNEPKQHNNITHNYTDQYEDASQFSNASQYNTAETAHTNNIYTRSNTNSYKPAYHDATTEITPQGWNTNNNNHHSSKPS